MSLYMTMRAIASKVYKLFYKLECTGFTDEKQKKTNNCIVCCNHVSNMDPIAIAITLNQKINFLGKEELFKNKIMKCIFLKLGVIPVNRGKSGTNVIKKACEVLKAGEVLGIFPEGTRSKNGDLLQPKSGTALIAFKTQANILPLGIKYEKKKLKRTKIILRCGEIIGFDKLLINDCKPSELKNASRFIMSKISKLISA